MERDSFFKCFKCGGEMKVENFKLVCTKCGEKREPTTQEKENFNG